MAIAFPPKAKLFSLARLVRAKSHERTISHQASMTTYYRAIVVGAGAAGIATVGNLLDNNVSPILWLDDSFKGGRLNRKYRDVPSNTKVSLFVKYGEACQPFGDIVGSSTTGTAYTALKSLDQNTGCQIAYVADLLLQLTEGLQRSSDIRMCSGHVESACQSQSGTWSVTTEGARSTSTINASPLLALCTGSSPNAPGLPATYNNLVALDLDLALNPSELSKSLSMDVQQTVAVIGASHSAILVIRNLYNLVTTSHPNLKIFWFSRHPLRYAVNKGDWILRDNTGLKGQVAEWAKTHLDQDDDAFAGSDVGHCIKRINTKDDETGKYDEFLRQCHYVVEATGFTRHALPNLFELGDDGKNERKDNISYDPVTGHFLEERSNQQIKGLYGAGIAFPEKVVDPEGNTEMAVGMWKFMRYLKRVVPTWVEDTRTLHSP